MTKVVLEFEFTDKEAKLIRIMSRRWVKDAALTSENIVPEYLSEIKSLKDRGIIKYIEGYHSLTDVGFEIHKKILNV